MKWINPFLRRFLKLRYRQNSLSIDEQLRNTCSYDILGNPGPLISDVFLKIQRIPGWFNFDDCTHFHLILSMQSKLGIKGDLFEIGSYHGRSTALMARYLEHDERIVICDAFDIDVPHNYNNPPSPEVLMKNIQLIIPNISSSKVIINRCASNNLMLNPEQKFRFIHIDGGHTEEEVKADLALCHEHIIKQGIIAVDDYCHPDFPGVQKGTDEFLRNNPDLNIIADINRHGAFGRKLYLIKMPKE